MSEKVIPAQSGEALETKPPPKISVDYTGTGRWGMVFHITDAEGQTIKLSCGEATNAARRILKIARGKE